MLKFSKIGPKNYAGDLLVYLVRQPGKGSPRSACGTVDEIIRRVHALGDFSGKEGEHLLFYPEKGRHGLPDVERIMVVGLGQEELSRELFRKAGGSIASLAMKSKAQELLLVLPDLVCDMAEMVEGLSEGLVLGAYRFRRYKSKKDPEGSGEMLQQAALYAADSRGVGKALLLGEIAAQAACLARDMANEPASHWTPAHFSEYGRQLAAAHGMRCTVLDQARMQKLGMGGIIGVNQGSAQPPEMIILEYAVKPSAPTLLLVGKGLTFDSGGISLKPSAGMEEMKYDMCGGAAVLCAMQAVAQAKLKRLNLVAIVPATENLPGPAALKPGDVIIQYGGKTVEVVNTDAEGRLILADALAYGIEKYKPDAVVALGCIVKGETDHDKYIASAVFKGLTDVTIQYGAPVSLGILTTNNLAQARARSRGKTNHGEKAAVAALQAALLK